MERIEEENNEDENEEGSNCKSGGNDDDLNIKACVFKGQRLYNAWNILEDCIEKENLSENYKQYLLDMILPNNLPYKERKNIKKLAALICFLRYFNSYDRKEDL